MSDLTPEQAVDIVARQLLANEARDIEWADTPDIGEGDWIWVADVMVELAPDQDNFDEAITLLERRAAEWQENNGA